jgi:hypothetical protein
MPRWLATSAQLTPETQNSSIESFPLGTLGPHRTCGPSAKTCDGVGFLLLVSLGHQVLDRGRIREQSSRFDQAIFV